MDRGGKGICLTNVELLPTRLCTSAYRLQSAPKLMLSTVRPILLYVGVYIVAGESH